MPHTTYGQNCVRSRHQRTCLRQIREIEIGLCSPLSSISDSCRKSKLPCNADTMSCASFFLSVNKSSSSFVVVICDVVSKLKSSSTQATDDKAKPVVVAMGNWLVAAEMVAMATWCTSTGDVELLEDERTDGDRLGEYDLSGSGS